MPQHFPVKRIAAAAFLYFATAFAAGFVLGTIRTLLVAPRIGATAAVVAEVPLMLLVAWFASGRAVRRFRVGSATAERLAMGALAFIFLIAAETIFGMVLFSRPLSQQLATYRATPDQIGLAAQLVYAAMPLLRRWGRTPSPRT